jgi:hypothetical protein
VSFRQHQGLDGLQLLLPTAFIVANIPPSLMKTSLILRTSKSPSRVRMLLTMKLISRSVP